MTVLCNKSLDLRALEPKARAAAFLEHLTSVPLGTPREFVTDAKPIEILARLQREYPGDFDWNVLAEGPPVWRVEVVRRERDHYHGVLDMLGEDHQRLDARFETILQLARHDPRTCRTEALALFSEFLTGLQRHIRAEEEILFPVFEQRTGMVGGPVFVMLQEHREIEAILGRIAVRLEAGEPADDLGEELRAVLGPHNQKEEQVLYVMTDRHLDAEERTALIHKLQQA